MHSRIQLVDDKLVLVEDSPQTGQSLASLDTLFPRQNYLLNPDIIQEPIGCFSESYGRPEPLIKGVLQKQSDKFIGSWSPRFCELSDSVFQYRKSEESTSKLAGAIDFKIIPCYFSSVSETTFVINVAAASKKFIFQADQGVAGAWLQLLQMAVTKYSCFGLIPALCYYPRFWRKNPIAQSEFQKIACTGDLILFRSTSASAALQRSVTMSEYGTLRGLIFHNSRKEVLIFQVNGSAGVTLNPWNRFMASKRYRLYELISHRRLQIERTSLFLNQISQFVEHNQGKPYNFTLGKVLFSRESSCNNQKEDFFCSELVAKLYKLLGLLNSEVSSSQYTPRLFSGDGSLNVQGECQYGPFLLHPDRAIVFPGEVNATSQTSCFNNGK